MYPVPSHSKKTVHVQSSGHPEFEKAYMKAHSRANRIVSDAELKELPNTFFYTMHRQSWARRANISQKLMAYLKKKNEEANIMDLGCGNGWLASRLAQYPGFSVAGVDINMIELEQAAKVFPEKELEFYFGDIFEDILPKGKWDFIILSETICYFPSLKKLINRCREYLSNDGEIHIIESPLFHERELDRAFAEQETFYNEIRVPEMIPHHFFHTRQDLQNFDYSFLYQPGRLKNMFNKDLSLHPWIRITN